MMSKLVELRRTEFMWPHMSEGRHQIGRSVDIEGRTGVVVDGDAFTITVQWDWFWVRWFRKVTRAEQQRAEISDG